MANNSQDPSARSTVMVALVVIQPRLDGAIDMDRVGNPLVLSPGIGLASLCAERDVAEGTANERLLYHSSSPSASRVAGQPR